jgi:hypothetical protein
MCRKRLTCSGGWTQVHTEAFTTSNAASCFVQVPLAAGADASEQQAAAQHMQHHQQLSQLVSDSIDMQLLRQLAATAAVPQPQAALPPAARTYRVSMGVARDEAFFRYFSQ